GRLAALGRYSGNRVVAVGHDCIPAVSGDLVPLEDSNRFAKYLSVIKFAHRVACVSVSAAAEFAGFAEALSAQGLRGPDVSECPLPSMPVALGDYAAPSDGRTGEQSSRPLVLCVGSFEPRKNQLSLLYAAERLWRE